MGDGTKENPYTREDVLRLIEENGGTAKSLELSEKVFEAGIDLSDLDLHGIILTKAIFPVHFERGMLMGANLHRTHLEGARLWHTHLERAYLVGAHLEDDANLRGAHLEGANLQSANLKGADLTGAHLEGAQLTDVSLSSDTKLHNVYWGKNYILAEESHGPLDWAEDTYRTLKMWHTQAGIYDIAAEFYYREMETKRKLIQRQVHTQFRTLKHKGFSKLRIIKQFLRFVFKQKDFGTWIRLWIYRLICGYGERPWHVVAWAVYQL